MEKKFNIIFVLFALLTFNFIIKLVSASNLTAALDWLKNNQNASGNWYITDWWGNYSWAPYTSLAATALYIQYGNSTNVTNALSWLSQLENFSEWQTGWSIGDVVGTSLYTFYQTSYLDMINLTKISENLLTFQNPDGGIKGFSDYLWNGTGYEYILVSDSADTAWALIGLISANSINDVNKSSAISFLESMQNSDGSLNLTNNTDMSMYEGLSPDKESNTALYLIAANAAGISNSNTTKALSYLKNSSITCFGNKNYSYTTALSAWAFSIFGETKYANSLANYLMILQNSSDGGFADSKRGTYPVSQALDTAIAAIAMEKVDVTDNPFNANITVNPTIGLGDTQKISVNTSGSILCTHNNYLAANITFPNGTVKQIILVFNPSSNNYENSFSETNMNGTYNVTAVVNPIFYDNITLNSLFEAKTKDGDSCSQNSECLNGYCVHSKCRSSSTYCGDGYCDSGESCSSCSSDCGQCQTEQSSSSSGSYIPTTTTSTTTSTTTTIPTTITTAVTTTVPPTTTTIKSSPPLTGMFLFISAYKWHLVFLVAIVALAIFILWKEDIIL